MRSAKAPIMLLLRRLRLFLVFILCCLYCGNALVLPPTSGRKRVSYNSNGKMKGMHITPPIVKAARLSFITIRMARDDDDDKKVNVNLIPDVDSFTLTSIGFGLIAFNFLILANVSGAINEVFSLILCVPPSSHDLLYYTCILFILRNNIRWETWG
jgi:hypothetical protein